MLPVTSGDLVFSVAPENEPNVPDRQGEVRPRFRYEETDPERTSRSTPDLKKGSLSIPNDPTPPGEPQPSRQLDDDDDDT